MHFKVCDSRDYTPWSQRHTYMWPPKCIILPRLRYSVHGNTKKATSLYNVVKDARGSCFETDFKKWNPLSYDTNSQVLDECFMLQHAVNESRGKSTENVLLNVFSRAKRAIRLFCSVSTQHGWKTWKQKRGPRQQSAAAALIAMQRTHFECIIIKLKTYPVYSGT